MGGALIDDLLGNMIHNGIISARHLAIITFVILSRGWGGSRGGGSERHVILKVTQAVMKAKISNESINMTAKVPV